MTRLFPCLIALTLIPTAALAHESGGGATGLVDGMMHPISGLDHLVAMIAVGIWGSILGRPLVIALPIIFPTLMALGAIASLAGMPIPPVELGIAASALVLGLAILFNLRPPVLVAVAVVGFFGLFHGYAHGSEAGPAIDPLGYVAGFVIMTGILHLAGIAIGEGLRGVAASKTLYRVCGAAVSLFGTVFIWNAIGLT